MTLPDDVRLLEPLVKDTRLERMEAVLARRTRNLSVLLEDPYDPHNVSAVLRTAEAFGLQDVHIASGPVNVGSYRPSPRVARGVERWLSVHHWRDADECIAHLESRGLSLAVADVAGGLSLFELDFTRPLVLAFGNEHHGPTERLLARAAVRFHIPMRGFVQSLNLSVAAAIAVHHAVQERDRLLTGGHGDLPESDRAALRGKWVLEDVRDGRRVLEEIRRRAACSPAKSAE